MPSRKKTGAAAATPTPTPGTMSYLSALADWNAFSSLNSKLARARAQDVPVLYPNFLPGLDVLLCATRGAVAPFRPLPELRQRCFESVVHALELPLEGLSRHGYWYDGNGFAFLVFASCAREAVMLEFGAPADVARRA